MLQEKIKRVFERVNHAALRSKEHIQVVVVTKGQSLALIREMVEFGVTDVGENYLQEALPKIIEARSLHWPVQWHFIGRIQSNKIKLIAAHFDWVQSVMTIQQAEKLNAARLKELPPLNICIQVNLDEASNKAGVDESGLWELLAAVARLPRLRLRGLMILPNQVGFEETDILFKKAFHCWQEVRARYPMLDVLSMGMSADFEQAILSGSTMVRLGRICFSDSLRF